MIFISHRKIDEDKALAINKFLMENNVKSYIDVLDPSLQAPIDITQRIVEQLRISSHVIVVFSNNTKGSLWVPFELGAAYESDKGIGVFLFDKPELPLYLDAFPILRDKNDLLLYIEEYKKDYQRLKKANDYLTESQMIRSSRSSYDFINSLKGKLG